MAAIGRPRKFDEAAALDAAMRVFWAKGYLGTSLDDLTAAMGINRPSLYGAFGDKQRLFLAAIERYLATFGAAPEAALQEAHIADALRGFFAASVGNCTDADTPAGCLVACGLAAASSEADVLRDRLAQIVSVSDAMLARRFARAIAEGELAADADPVLLARMANSLRHGVALRARAGEPHAALLAMAAPMAAMMLAAAGGPKSAIVSNIQ